MSDPFQLFDLAQLTSESERGRRHWTEFLRTNSLSMGIYHLRKGHVDEQKPHAEDEVYLVLSGKSSFRVGGRVLSISTGSLIFVEKLVDHRFFDIAEDLMVLVFFAPAEGSMRGAVDR